MKQFSLEEYLKNPERKIVTRDGRSVRIVCTNKCDDNYPIVALICEMDNYESMYAYTENGVFSKRMSSEYDLFFTPIKRECWINLYKSDDKIIELGRPWNTKEEALRNTSLTYEYITTVKIDWEE